MIWNWQLKNWPNFKWNKDKLEKYEHEFILKSGVIIGSSEHISNEDKQDYSAPICLDSFYCLVSFYA